MMKRIDSFADIVRQWPSMGEMAADMQQQYDTIRKWRDRDSIPSAMWFDLLRAAKRRKIVLSAEDLILLARNGATIA
jgi:hypothetical protein